MNEPSVIQTTASDHADRCNEAVDISKAHIQLLSPLSPEELAAYHMGMRHGWACATFAILQHGNCRFEKE